MGKGRDNPGVRKSVVDFKAKIEGPLQEAAEARSVVRALSATEIAARMEALGRQLENLGAQLEEMMPVRATIPSTDMGDYSVVSTMGRVDSSSMDSVTIMFRHTKEDVGFRLVGPPAIYVALLIGHIKPDQLDAKVAELVKLAIRDNLERMLRG